MGVATHFFEIISLESQQKCFGFQYNFRQITVRFSAGRRKQLVVSDMLLFWCSWFKYWFIKLDLVTVGRFCFHFVVYVIA